MVVPRRGRRAGRAQGGEHPLGAARHRGHREPGLPAADRQAPRRTGARRGHARRAGPGGQPIPTGRPAAAAPRPAARRLDPRGPGIRAVPDGSASRAAEGVAWARRTRRSAARVSRMTSTTTLDWTAQLSEQLEWHWHGQLRPRFEGLTDDEYFWEPAQPAWNVRPRTGEGQPGTGPFTVDFAYPEPDPPPVTTIAWRLAHIIVGVLGARVGVALRRPGGGLRQLRVRGHGRRGARAAGRGVRALDGGRARSRRGGAGAAVRAGGGPVRRLPDGGAGAAHQPGGDPPRGRGRAPARPLPGAVRRRAGRATRAVRRSGPTRPGRRRTGGRRPAPPGRRRRPAAPTPHATSRTAAGRRAGRSPPARGRRLR